MGSLLHEYSDCTWVLREKPLWFGPWGGTSGEGRSSSEFREMIEATPLDYPCLWSRLPCGEHPQEDMVFVVPEQWGREPARLD